MKKVTKVVLIIVVILLLGIIVIGMGAWSMFGTKITAANTVTKLQDGLYSMEYVGDYGVEELMARGGAANTEELADYLIEFLSNGFYTPETEEPTNAYGCSAISAKNANGEAVFGRNYDWEKCSAVIVHTAPENGYESISTACLDFLGFGEGWVPEGMGNQMMALAAIYIPLDGMNEKGLVVADLMAGDDVETHQDTEKPNVTTTLAIRLLLDHAATVDEAIALLEEYDMNSDIGKAHHYAIADASGKSVVVEYVDGEMMVTETNVLTNHYLADCEKQGVGRDQSHDRYNKLVNLYENTQGILEMDDVRDALQSVSQGSYHDEYEITVWSIVYRHSESGLVAEFYWKENYEDCYSLTLKAGEWLK